MVKRLQKGDEKLYGMITILRTKRVYKNIWDILYAFEIRFESDMYTRFKGLENYAGDNFSPFRLFQVDLFSPYLF